MDSVDKQILRKTSGPAAYQGLARAAEIGFASQKERNSYAKKIGIHTQEAPSTVTRWRQKS